MKRARETDRDREYMYTGNATRQFFDSNSLFPDLITKVGEKGRKDYGARGFYAFAPRGLHRYTVCFTGVSSVLRDSVSFEVG